MNSLNRIAAGLVIAPALVLGFSAMAQPPQDSSAGDARPQRDSDARRDDDRFCIQETGSRIVASRNARSNSERKECVNAGGRVYTREDIERTGSTNLKEALQRLDPSVF